MIFHKRQFVEAALEGVDLLLHVLNFDGGGAVLKGGGIFDVCSVVV